MTHRKYSKAFSAALAMLAMAGITVNPAHATNDTFANRAYSTLGVHNTGVSAPAGTSVSRYYTFRLTAGRSYLAHGYMYWGPDARLGTCNIEWYDSTGVFVAGAGGDEEPADFGADGDSLMLPNAPGGSFEYTVRLIAGAPAGGSATCYLRVVETTLFSPWFLYDPGLGYDGFAEIKNTTTSTISVRVNAFSPAGAIVGSTTVNVPANGVALVTASSLGAPAGFGAMSIAHTGMLGGIVANITTLSASTGVSFDAPFATRELIPRF